MEMKPIGYMQSVFKYKNGTPRQPMLCEHARGILRIEKSIFNNPEHSLEGLNQFSHVWILFVFHKNGGSVSKAKVRPPRLDGRRVGVFSTRSPHRPNPIGLTLARLDKVEGSCISFSGIDILDGTPILDVKPYIQEYDAPIWKSERQISSLASPKPNNIDLEDAISERTEDLGCETAERILCTEGRERQHEENSPMEADPGSQDSILNESSQQPVISNPIQFNDKLYCEHTDSHKLQLRFSERKQHQTEKVSALDGSYENHVQQDRSLTCSSGALNTNSCLNSSVSSLNGYTSTNEDILLENKDCLAELKLTTNNKGSHMSAAKISSSWIPEINIKLGVRFTERAETQLKLFSKHSINCEYKLALIENCSELRHSIISILSEDPRSVYRRHKCQESLYHFTVDRAHVTCWFDGNVAEIVRLQSIDMVTDLLPQD